MLKHPDSEAVSLPQDHSGAACPICAASNTQHLCEVDGYQVLRCPQCATDFVFPAPDKAALQAYYDRAAWFEGGERGGYQSYDAQTAPVLPFFDGVLDSFGADAAGLSILDIGCGYGTHLSKAYQRGWKCFGVEISAHARQVAVERHGHAIFVVDDVDQLIPHEFDLIILFDVIEHLANPYHLFYTLFAKGAITPKTRVIISTPNARSLAAVTRPAQWAYRHPPSHLVFFSAQALTVLLQRLHFVSIEVHGLHDEAGPNQQSYPDESYALNDELAQFAGIVCNASGSDFAGFMQERYVPGTWSKIAEYEHLPRYLFARDLAKGRQVLDFGCGTGYGTAILAQQAKSVIGIDIDTLALEWARAHHKKSNLSYEQRADLGASLPAASFDFITCFEMIEHVPEALQIEAVRNFARLLTKDGLTIISTPNPEITKLYGENPYHIREMNRFEFETLLREHFQHVEFFEQYIQPSVFITPETSGRSNPIRSLTWGPVHESSVEPAVFIGVCSHSPIAPLDGSCFLDFRTDFIKEKLEADAVLNRTRFDYFQAVEQAAGARAEAAELQKQNQRVVTLETELHARNVEVMEVEAALHARNLQVMEVEAALHARNLQVMEVEAALHARNLQVMERDARLVELDALVQATKTELARYNWIRKIDRTLIKR